MKASEQYFPVVLFIMLYKVILTFESVDEILKCDHSNESCYGVFSFSAVCFPLFRKMIFGIVIHFSAITLFGLKIFIKCLRLTFFQLFLPQRVID